MKIKKSDFLSKYENKPKYLGVILTLGVSGIYDSLSKSCNLYGLEYFRKGRTDFIFYLPFTDQVFHIRALSVVGCYWRNSFVKEISTVDEVVLTPGAERRVINDELYDNVYTLLNGKYSPSDPAGKVLQSMGGDSLIPLIRRSGGKLMSISPDFYFPITLYRDGMKEYFYSPLKPTREEFLFSIMVENLSGITKEEKSAIEEADIYVKNEGNLPRKDKT